MSKGIALLAALAVAGGSGVAHAAAPTDPYQTSTYRDLNNPTGGDMFMARLAIQQNAQDVSDRIFGVLQGILGGQAPTLNFVATGSPDLASGSDLSAVQSSNAINIDPIATEGVTNTNSLAHNPAFLDVSHEMAHLRQTAQILANLAQREGGAQAFADYVTPTVASRLNIPFTPGNYDANYAPYVQQVQPLGMDWLLGGQFGHAPVQFP